MANGFSGRRQRSSSLRDSPAEDGMMELQESARFRDRGSRKDRDWLSRNKRRRGDRLMHGSNREGREDSSEESVDDEEEDEDEDGEMVRMLPPNPASLAASNHHHRRSFPTAKVVRATQVWKVSDEMIGVSVPRKARSASAKRTHDWSSGEHIHRQKSISPARPSVVGSSPAPMSPSSSNASMRKKMKPVGPKQRPSKISKSSSTQEDIEFEVAEVLFGLMRQSQDPKEEVMSSSLLKGDPKDVNGLGNDAKSRISSHVSASVAPQSSLLIQNSCCSNAPVYAVAPKRKRPRPVKYEEDNKIREDSVSSVSKVEKEQLSKTEISSPKLEKDSGSALENGGSFDLGTSSAAGLSELQLESIKLESNTTSDSKPLIAETEAVEMEEEAPAPKKESPSQVRLDVDLEDATAKKAVPTVSEMENHREEKFKIDLMAPPPWRSSPERDCVVEFASSDPKRRPENVEMVQKMETVSGSDAEKIRNKSSGELEMEEKSTESMVEEAASQKQIIKERILDLQLEPERHDRDSSSEGVSFIKILPHIPKHQQQQKVGGNDAKIEKIAQSTSLPLQITVAGWPGGLPPLGYMPPIQAVVSVDGSTGSSTAVQPPHFLQAQPRPKRCATHYYIARNIYYHQQFTRMNPFWPAAAGSASLYGTKPYNLNAMPPTETSILGNPLKGSFPVRSSNTRQDKVQAAAIFPGNSGKEKNSMSANFVDTSERKQFALQQAAPLPASGGLLHGPAFIFPISQQQVATAPATRSGAAKPGTPNGNQASSTVDNSGPGTPISSSTTASPATTMSFSYPNMSANEAQYLTILQNNGYPFHIPPQVGAPPAYRGGAHAQAMPFFNGSFYSSQMLHPSQLQQQLQSHSQPQSIQQIHQNPSTSSGPSSSQKHPLTQQQRLQAGDSNGNLPMSKNRFLAAQQPLQQQNQHVSPNQARQLEAGMGGEDGPSTAADGRISHAAKNAYGQNFAIPFHPQNFALMNAAALGSGNQGEMQQQQPHHQGLKNGVELIPSQAFAMSFGSFNGAPTAPAVDFSSMSQNHALFQSLPEAARHGYQIVAAAAAQASQQKSHQIAEAGKPGGESINVDDERKGMAGNVLDNVGQSLSFARPETTDSSVSTMPSNTVIDSSARTLSLISAPVSSNRVSCSNTSIATATTTSTVSPTTNSKQQQQQQLIQLQKQQQQLQRQHQLAAAATATARSKSSAASTSSFYSDRLPSSSSMAAKYPNALSVFPQTLIQGSSPSQSSQWKNSARIAASPVHSPSMPSPTTSSSLKNLPQQQSRTQQGHTQISFGVNPKSGTVPQTQQIRINQSPSPMVGSPPTPSLSMNAGGSPRMASTASKAIPTTTLSSQKPKSSQSGSSRKSSPVGGRSVPSMVSNAHITTTPSPGVKAHLHQQQQQKQQQQQQMQKQSLQQAQLFFSNAYMQAQYSQSSTPSSTTSATGAGYYHHRPQPEQQQQQHQGSSTTSSTGTLSLCATSLSLAGATTSDPAKAVANNMKASGLTPPGLLHAAQLATQSAGNAHQLMSAAFSYIHAVPTAVQVKPPEQKQPGGNDNLHTCWQPEKKR